MASVDGLSDAEITKILFKNYMNFASTNRDFEFFEEGNITNTTNIFATNVMKDTPLTEPTFRDATTAEIKSKLKDFSITDGWLDEKLQAAGSTFKIRVDPNDPSVIRFEDIKLDYTGKNSDAFYCEDANGVNILNHLLPFNYGNEAATLNGSFAITLKYKKQNGSNAGDLLSITWLATHGACQTTVDGDSGEETIAWGAPLFDTKNGVITFYDTTSDLGGSAVFDTASPPEFFFSATKYVGDFGVGSDSSGNSDSSDNFWEQDASLNISYTSGNVSISGDLDVSRGIITAKDLMANVVKIGYTDSVGVSGEGVSGEGVSGETYSDVSGPVLDVSGDVSFNGRVDISGTLYVNGIEISGNSNSGGSWNTDGNNNTSGDLTVGGDLDVSGMINMDGDIVATQEWVNNQSFASGTSGGGGAVAGVAITDDTTLTAINIATDLSENHNEYKTVHRSNQPPSLESVSSPITESPSEFKIEWNYFEAHFIDSYDGRVYPLSLQTFVDVSYTLHTGANSGGYVNVYVGQGTYDFSGIKVNGCEELTIPNSGFPFRNDTGDKRLYFEGRLDEGNIPPFMAGSVFDFKVYAINQSQTIQPRYIEIKGAQLSSTGPPGKVSIVDFDDFEQNSFTMDFSFNLDASDNATTSGIKITDYDISYALTDSRSFVTPTDSDVKEISGSDLSKDDVVLDNLYPGAIYDVEVRAKNETSTDIGQFGDVSNSVIYTNTGPSNQYITYNDLVTVNPEGIAITLVGMSSIECCIAADTITIPAPRYIANSNSNISLSGTSDFYINYGMQGKSMEDNIDANLVQFIARKGTKQLGGSLSFPSPMNIDLVAKNPGDTNTLDTGSTGYYKFTSTAYQDAYDDTNSKNQGFVYKVTVNPSHNGDTFTTSFPPGSSEYIYKYNIACDSTNNNTTLDGTNASVEVLTNSFFVDNYNTTPNIQYTTAPAMVETNYSVMFGVPSVTKVTLTASIQISNFASFLIPHLNGVHSFTDAITDSAVYVGGFQKYERKNLASSGFYNIPYTDTVDIVSGTFKSSPSHTFNTTVYYLDHTNQPTRLSHSVSETFSYASSELFRDTVTDTNYFNNVDIYLFGNGSFSPFGKINTFSNFLGGTSLLYFNGKWVSGGYKATYNGVEIDAFRDWTTVSTHGSDLSSRKNDDYDGYKWIVFDVTNKKSPNGARLDLSNLKLNGSSVTTNDHNITYKGYIATVSNNNIIYGSFNSVTKQAPLWPNASYSTLAAADAGSGAWTTVNDLSTMLADANDNNKSYYLIIGLPYLSTDYIEFS